MRVIYFCDVKIEKKEMDSDSYSPKLKLFNPLGG